MGLRIYNTLKREKELFEPLNAPYVGMYVCGPTVYGDSHLGHARSYTVFDVIYRYLGYSGYKVRYVQNITDVGHLVGNSDDGEDKISKQAALEKLEPVEIAYKYELSYFQDMECLNILKPNISCRATGHILEMVEYIHELLKKGYAYVTKEGNVYFEVKKFPSYGKLSGRKLEEAKSGERIEVASDKRNPEDFALWKSAAGSHLMKWNSPWGEGYPGWHIECSVMSRKYIGDTLDIHGGGMDNIFPHHECEIAQSEAFTGKPFAKYFIHNNMLTVNGTKMGKSAGNFIVLKELFQKIDPMVLRFYILQSHYRSVLDFSEESLQAASNGYERMKNSIFALHKVEVAEEVDFTQFPDLEQQRKGFMEAMDDDLNTPIAVSIVYEILKISNRELAKAVPNQEKLAAVKKLLCQLTEEILGFRWSLSEEKQGAQMNLKEGLIEFLIEIRKNYRDEKNFAMSDRIRDGLKELGVVLKDSPQGTTYSVE